MNEKIKTIIAFSLLVIICVVGITLTVADKGTDVYPNENTKIFLYGEMHGYKEYYDAEFEEWRKLYDEGCRNFFIELPYYSAEFVNVWMNETSDETLDLWFEEIQGTASGNANYYEFFQKIKKYCPETVFYGTDVGHQFDTTGARYLKYLEDNGLETSRNYALAKECIRQGIEFSYDSTANNGVSTIRESHMVSNFIDAYARCGGGKIMGVYGGYHTNLNNHDLMAGRLKAKLGNVISSVNISTVAFSKIGKPYDVGFCVTGVVFLLMLFVPNIVWAKKAKPAGYEESAKKENKALLVFERVGEALTSVSLLIFTAINPKIMIVGNVYFEWKIIIWLAAVLLMVLYECYWLKYFKGPKTMKNLYSSFAGFPVAGATLPVLSCLMLGIYSGNAVLIVSSIILGIGHIGIHLTHKKEADE